MVLCGARAPPRVETLSWAIVSKNLLAVMDHVGDAAGLSGSRTRARAGNRTSLQKEPHAARKWTPAARCLVRLAMLPKTAEGSSKAPVADKRLIEPSRDLQVIPASRTLYLKTP